MTDPMTIGVSLKLYLDARQTAAWCAAVAELVRRHPATVSGRARLFVVPSLPMAADSIRAFVGTGVRVGAQDLFWEDRGASTGGISGLDLAELGCELVEVGHAERRTVFGEDESVVARKLAAAVRCGLLPVLCVGEPDRGPAEDAAAFCVDRLDARLAAAGVDASVPLVVAYEPEWAIGAERPAHPEHVRIVTSALSERMRERAGGGSLAPTGSAVLYGGSAGPGLLSTLHPDVDGLFLGRFAHDPHALELVLDEVHELTVPAG